VKAEHRRPRSASPRNSNGARISGEWRSDHATVYRHTPISLVSGKLRTGTTIADSAANAQSGDIVWPAVINGPSTLALRPLDAAAQSLMPPGTAKEAWQWQREATAEQGNRNCEGDDGVMRNGRAVDWGNPFLGHGRQSPCS
jgi:hypothetical protein